MTDRADRAFTVIPAIDIKEGRCVRLWQGDMGKETIYSESPEDVASKWEDMGASIIHVVDLDGAVSGKMINRPTIEKIVSSVSTPIQVGGGIRDRERMDLYYSIGVHRIVLGTAACRNPEKLGELLSGFPGKVFVGIDAREGMVAVEGWKETLSISASIISLAAQNAGAAGIIYTDISRDGTLEGPNFDSIKRFLIQTDLPVIASGGVSTIHDIAALSYMAPLGVTGVIVGRALYTGSIDLKDALRFSSQSGSGA